MTTADPLLQFADELRRLGHRLDGMGGELLQMRAAGGSWAPTTAPGPIAPAQLPTSQPPTPWPRVQPSTAPPPMMSPPMMSPPRFWPVPPGTGPAGAHPAAVPGVGTRPAPSPRPARSFPALSGARLLAWTGGAVTLLGVVMLLVLAASRGWFSPQARIGAGAALGVALVATGWWLHRRESARTGAIALAATGVATLYLVVAAATAVYDFLDTAPALLLALAVAACGLGLADRWRVQLLACGAVAGAALLAPVLAGGWLLVALVLALQLAALPVVLRRHWPVLMLLAAAGPVLYGSVYGLLDGGADPATIGVAIAVLVVGVATVAAATGRLDQRPVSTLVAATAMPAIATGTTLDGWRGAALVALAAVVMGALAARRGADRGVRWMAAAVAVLALFLATATALDGATLTAVLLGEAIVAGVLAYLSGARFPLVAGVIYGLFGVAEAIAVDAPLGALVQFPAYPYTGPDAERALLTAVIVSTLVFALAAWLLLAGGRVGWIRPDWRSAVLWVPIGLVGLYGAASLVVVLALLVSPDRAGFTAGHALVTVSWTVAALVLLARGISRTALRTTGLVLVAAAVVKLVLFDLVTLDGIARVAAFLGAGLVLLAAGTRYARLVAEAGTGAPAEPEASGIRG